jgi:hypothetical protein
MLWIFSKLKAALSLAGDKIVIMYLSIEQIVFSDLLEIVTPIISELVKYSDIFLLEGRRMRRLRRMACLFGV